MGTEIGSRVIALLEAKDGVVRSFGEGVYVGDFPVSPDAGGLNFGQEGPRIHLDNGKVVWGCECWWGSADAVRARFPAAEWKWELVDIEDHRRSQKEDTGGSAD